MVIPDGVLSCAALEDVTVVSFPMVHCLLGGLKHAPGGYLTQRVIQIGALTSPARPSPNLVIPAHPIRAFHA